MVEYDRARAKKKKYVRMKIRSQNNLYARKMFDNLRITRRRIEKVGV